MKKYLHTIVSVILILAIIAGAIWVHVYGTEDAIEAYIRERDAKAD